MCDLIFNINDFQGPLDLLLHLIKEKKIDILNLDLKNITNQYLDFIFKEENINIDKISEYLPIAAYLLELQSKQLLPDLVNQDIDSNYEAEINRQKVINRILEYKKFKEITSYFQEQALKRQKLYSKEVTDLKTILSNNPSISILAKNNINQLSQAMLNLWKKLQSENKLPVNLNLNLISAEDRALEIEQYLKNHKDQVVPLQSLFLVKELNLHYFIITFIAILDLANHQVLSIIQTNNFSLIMVKYKGAKNND